MRRLPPPRPSAGRAEAMRNKFPGTCYRCGGRVEPGDGHFERFTTTYAKWRMQHADCAIAYRGTEVGNSLPRGPSGGPAERAPHGEDWSR